MVFYPEGGLPQAAHAIIFIFDRYEPNLVVLEHAVVFHLEGTK